MPRFAPSTWPMAPEKQRRSRAPEGERRPRVPEEELPVQEHRAEWSRFRLPSLRGGRRFGRRTRLLVGGGAALVSALLVLLLAPVPFLDTPLVKLASGQVADQMSCPGTAVTKPPKVTFGGGRLLPQLLRRRLSEIRLQMFDAAVGGVKHADFSATLRNVSQPKPGTTHVGSIDASITLGFANMPSLPDISHPTFGRSPDGLLTVGIVPSAEMSKNVKATLLAKLELQGETMKVVPRQLLLFGKAIPAEQASSQIGGVRTEKLPDLPDGLTYKSVIPKKDGLHVALGGTVTTPFSELPTKVDEQPVSYKAQDGMLGISTSKDIPLIGTLPLTIFTSPRINDGVLELVPQSVEVLGSNRKPDDPIAALVLRQVNQKDLSRKLPALPSGVQYRSVSVDSAGVKVVVGGVTVKAFSELPATVEGRPTTYGAQDGLLAVITSGATADRPMPIVLHTKPTIAGTTLDLAPQQVEMFGVLFPARDVLAGIKADMTKFPLQALPTNLNYRGVEILANGLRITVGGKNVTMGKGALC
ncbi:MAG: hypothetical protein QG608_3177 [Actinomycetota bacterium]|nr:hypothetical protein [Actinomycetota bacterium]